MVENHRSASGMKDARNFCTDALGSTGHKGNFSAKINGNYVEGILKRLSHPQIVHEIVKVGNIPPNEIQTIAIALAHVGRSLRLRQPPYIRHRHDWCLQPR